MDDIRTHAWAIDDIGSVIPHTVESMWSGHFFPIAEANHESQISSNLCMFSYYKQAMASLRSALELGLLSVYWNLEDDGHEIIQKWLHSQEDTPRLPDIWSKLRGHHNFLLFNELYPFKEELMEFNLLHNYVHTKGGWYSNQYHIAKAGPLRFHKDGFSKWINTYKRIVRMVCILHLVKYPIGTAQMDYWAKFGIDVPMFGGLEPHQIGRLKRIIGQNAFEHIEEVARNDEPTQSLIRQIEQMPDIAEDEIDEQIIRQDKLFIPGMGYREWHRREVEMMEQFGEEVTDKHRKRFDVLQQWAQENNLLDSPEQRRQQNDGMNDAQPEDREDMT